MHQVVLYSSSTTMASYPSSSFSLASQSPHPRRYDVFISFRGEDTRRSFSSHLYDALCQKDLLTFIDDDEFQSIEEIEKSIVQAIQESKVSVVVFSKGYASSTRCLAELVKIIECRQTRGQVVIPVFYDVNSYHIRKQSHYVAEAFERHEQNPRNAHKIQYWRDALVRTAELYGFNSENFGDDGILISEIVKDISKILVKSTVFSSSSSSSSWASQSPHPWRYDVFISFMEDTHRSFSSHLRDALRRKELRTVIEDDVLERGKEIAESNMQAIQESNVAVVVFSKDYASSTWCLDQLVKIIECHQNRGQIVIPLFYDVYPSDIRKQSGDVAAAFVGHEQNPRNAHKIKYWRDALIMIANLSGFHSKKFRNDRILLSKIVEYISKILVKSTVCDGDQQLGLDHFLHKHELLFADIKDHDSVTCAGCMKQVLGRSYHCFDCKFYLHESCTNIPLEIYHFTHSCPLILVISKYNTRICEACGERCRGFLYDCGRCSWGVHYSCTLKQLPNTITNPEAQEQIESPLHRHPLSPVEKMREDNGVLCEVCGELCFGPTYYECSVCSFYVHKSCVEIPKQLYSFYHKCRYFLTLLICPSYECGACTRAGLGVSYACIRCGFRLHLKCALKLPGNFEGLPHICHNLMKKTDCLSCNFPLEKPCSEHILEVQSPLHPEHTLFLYKSPDIWRCNVCLGDCPSGFFFRCDKCDFYCGPECIYLIPTIQFANHGHHLLTVVDRVYGDVECDTCQKNCKGKPALRCLECKFNLHLVCGPLPHTIKHEHTHRLTFEDYIIDRKDEQYCYHCEEKRNPDLGVYYCKGCEYTAEVDCVMSEVMACLRGEREETVVLRCLHKQITKNNRVIIRENAVKKLHNDAINENLSEDELETEPSLFLDDVFECLNEDEQNKFRNNIKTMVTELSWPTEYNDILGYIDEESIEEESSGSYNDLSSEERSGNERRGHDHNIPEVSPYSEKAFTQLIEKLDSGPGSRKKIKLVLSDDEKQLVKYGKYITPRIFIPILKQLINGKHGDISSGSMLDPRIKSICFMYLSEVIYSMRRTKVLKIKKDMLHTWWNRTKMLELVGFKVDFIQDRLMLVASAYFGLKARNFAKKTSEKQVSEIEQLRKNIKVLMARVEELEVEHRNHLEYLESATTQSMVNHFSDADAMQWRPAAEGLL